MTKEEFISKSKYAGSRKLMAQQLLTMLEDNGWGILKVVLESQVDNLRERIENLDTSEKDLQMARIQLHYCRKVLGMPEVLIKQLQTSKASEAVDKVYD